MIQHQKCGAEMIVEMGSFDQYQLINQSINLKIGCGAIRQFCICFFSKRSLNFGNTQQVFKETISDFLNNSTAF